MSASRTIRKLTVLSHVTSLLASYEFITLLCLLSWVTDWSRWLVLLTYLTQVIFLPERRSYCFLLLGANYMIWYPWTSCIATVTSIYSFQHSKYSPHTYYYKPSISPSWFFRPHCSWSFWPFTLIICIIHECYVIQTTRREWERISCYRCPLTSFSQTSLLILAAVL